MQLPYSTEEFISRLMSKCPQDVIGGMFDINPFRNEQVAQWHSKLDDVLSKRTYLR